MVALILWLTLGRRIATAELFIELALGLAVYAAVIGRTQLARLER
jgi:hypothetical protein